MIASDCDPVRTNIRASGNREQVALRPSLFCPTLALLLSPLTSVTSGWMAFNQLSLPTTGTPSAEGGAFNLRRIDQAVTF